jgi:hypothetical protein
LFNALALLLLSRTEQATEKFSEIKFDLIAKNSDVLIVFFF